MARACPGIPPQAPLPRPVRPKIEKGGTEVRLPLPVTDIASVIAAVNQIVQILSAVLLLAAQLLLLHGSPPFFPGKTREYPLFYAEREEKMRRILVYSKIVSIPRPAPGDAVVSLGFFSQIAAYLTAKRRCC